MTKKDFEAIAAVLRDVFPTEARESAAFRMADYLKTRNPRFDEGRFLIACDVECK
jgi:hypothetical protein